MTGLLLNCINSGLYMANYNLILPPITEVCRHIGVKNSMVGIIVGACDIATVFGTVGVLSVHAWSACLSTACAVRHLNGANPAADVCKCPCKHEYTLLCAWWLG